VSEPSPPLRAASSSSEGRWEIAGWALLAGLHLALAARLVGPMMFGDETAYLGIARLLAGRPAPRLASPAMAVVSFYQPGYALLLAPGPLLHLSPLACYRWGLAVNALLLAALFPLLAAYGRRALALPPRRALLAAAAASLYPAFLLQSTLTWSENLLLPGFVVLVLAFHGLAARPGAGPAARFAGLAAALYGVHQRALGLVPLALLALAVLAWRRRLAVRAALLGGAAAVAGFAAVRIAGRLLAVRLWAAAPPPGESGLAAALLRPGVLANCARFLAGQLWYLAVGSLGLAVVGALALARRAAGRGDTEEARRATALFLLAAAAVLLATAALFGTELDRPDKLIYGRYAETFLGPFLVAGLAAPRRGRWREPALFAVAPAALTAVLLARAGGAFQGLRNPFNILAVEPWALAVGGLRPLRIAALATLLALALAALRWRAPRAAAALAGLLFLAASLFVHERWLLPANRAVNDTVSIPIAVARLGGVQELAYDESHFAYAGFFAYPFWLPDLRFAYFASARTPPPAPLVISGKSFGRAHPEARLVFPESGSDQALWAMPGPWQERLAAAGLLAPRDPLAPLPAAACRSALAWVDGDRPLALAAGDVRELRLRVGHRGTGAPWLPAGARDDPRGAVRLAVRWFLAGRLAADGRVELPRALLPGETIEVVVPLAARRGVGGAGDGSPLAPGRYTLEVGLVQELVQWFADAGDRPLRRDVEVRP